MTRSINWQKYYTEQLYFSCEGTLHTEGHLSGTKSHPSETKGHLNGTKGHPSDTKGYLNDTKDHKMSLSTSNFLTFQRLLLLISSA